jgi:xanthine/uracil/vitamin C permease (AzgA family)
VLFIVVLFPVLLTHLPEYALGIIMVYSGWKMMANIAHVRTHGLYALTLSIVCGFLVFELGIFEGLLIVLAMHGLVKYLFKSKFDPQALTAGDMS